ncbi:hypothetical protein CDD81_7166 [Ophiocordyceps australis]|uniref:FAD/NAD(P)-binding domain-containing protein n=1 Tax=Ophiocordyceps australis TaxID=1399860 RepID=A0A2C5Y4L4_9HYPO|nr:hypothetical protein CDD81_7166 [Ophiocordyceps australis]
MSSKVVIIGAGFAGVWSALSARRLINLQNKQGSVQVVVVAPEPTLVMRPRLYEEDPATKTQNLTCLFHHAGIHFIQGTVESIHTETQTLDVQGLSGDKSVIDYDRLVLAAGSNLVRPSKIAGLQQHVFDIDSIESASKLEEHLKSLSSLPPSTARDTLVICGAGFTGIELAAELPRRFKSLRIILVEAADSIGPELGPGPRPAITAALEALRIQVKLGSAVASVDATGVTLVSGERIKSMTVVWTAGVRATPLTQQIPGTRDSLNRLQVDGNLRNPSSPHVFATGDAACAVAHPSGQTALMSCQHAIVLGLASGHNAAADLVGVPLFPYSHVAYSCCLDLGSCGAVIARGYDRKEILLTGLDAKKVKSYINQKLIYPPTIAEEAIVAADPDCPDSDELFAMLIKEVGVY